MIVVQTLLALAYPLMVYVALHWFEPREVALASLALIVLRLLFSSPARLAAHARTFAAPAASVVLASSVTLFANDARTLMLTPALVSFALLATFGASFLQRETTVERIARAGGEDLPAEAVSYCRKVTAVWCGFFLVNGAIALELALQGSQRAWAVYTGLVAYVLLGLLFAAEYAVRQWRFRRYTGARTDEFWKLLFPPRSSP